MANIAPATPRHGGGQSKTANTRRPSNSSIGPSPSIASHDREQSHDATPDNDKTHIVQERKCILWVHDEQFSKEEVVFNLRLFPRDSLKPGQLLAIVALKTDTGTRDFQAKSPLGKRGHDHMSASLQLDPTISDTKLARDSVARDLQHDADADKRYMFEARDMSSELRTRHPHLEISISKHVADAFGFKNRTNVLLTTANIERIEASHVELSFKDEYLARSDMWRLTVSELSNKTVYKNQRILFLDTIKATITAVYVAGRKVQSAFFNVNTKPIFRSESARYVLFIQMSREMWDFDSEGSGEIMFTKVVNGFLPALFRRWQSVKARHLVSIVLFTRVEYDVGMISELDADKLGNPYYTGFQMNESRKPYKDFYRVVISEMASGEWTSILGQLKTEFRFFRHDISMHRLNATETPVDPEKMQKGMGAVPGTAIEAEPSLAIHGNILEAINLASTQFNQDHIDRDLVRTGISIVVITPGTGIFEVDYETLRASTEQLVGTGIGIDLVCLPKIPLHSVPLFRYRNPHFTQFQDEQREKVMTEMGSTPRQTGPVFGSYSSMNNSMSPTKFLLNDKGQRTTSFASHRTSDRAPDEWSFAIPHWLDVSFWTDSTQDLSSKPRARLSKKQKARSTVRPMSSLGIRCKMYELEMEGGVSGTIEVSIPPLALELDPTQFITSRGDPSRADNQELIRPKRRHTNLLHALTNAKGSARNLPHDKKTLEAFEEFDRKKAYYSVPSARKARFTDLKETAKAEDEALQKSMSNDRNTHDVSLSKMSTGSGFATGLIPTRGKVVESFALSNKRKESFSSIRSSTTLSSMKMAGAQLRPPKSSRQISLGKYGFGIAAPKAPTVGLQIENAKADTVSTISIAGQGNSSSMMASALRSDKPSERPNSSQGSLRTSLKSPISPVTDARSVRDIAQKSSEMSKTHPIAIRPAAPSPATTSTGTMRSKLGSVYERTATAKDPEDLPTLEKLKSSDNLRASKVRLMNGSEAELPAALSPTTALSPWLNVLNPSNPRNKGETGASQYKRWQHVFPKPHRVKAMKWKSLCSPASIPLTTEFCPTKQQLDREYVRNTCNLSQNLDDSLNENPKTRDEFLRELIGLRLSQGFQIVVGSAPAEAFGQKVLKIANVFDRKNIAEDGASVFMSLGNVIHQLSCVNGTEIEVDMFQRKVAANETLKNKLYRPAIKTTLAEDYETREILLEESQSEVKWNIADSFVAGHDGDFSENLRYWRARFVLIPADELQKPDQRQRWEDTDEETRLEGIRVLTQMWQRNRHNGIQRTGSQSTNLASRRGRNPNPLDIVYRTQDPSVVVNAELETLPLDDAGEMSYGRRGKLLTSADPFRRSKLDLTALAEAIQAPVEKGGVRMQNRRWHFRLHYNCFIGSDMTSWFMENFDDIVTREEAVELGNRLMVKDEAKLRLDDASDDHGKKESGLFVHVEKRHAFRDGQYFYQIAGDHAKPRPETRSGWGFASRKKDPSIPSTPMIEAGKDSPKPDRSLVSAGNEDRASDSGGVSTPAMSGILNQRRPKFYLTKMIRYNVDSRNLSYRPELINLHYDRLHNPDNCYHIRIEWLNVTAKLIEDAIQSWAKTAERYKLRLIEVPINEACTITDNHPFRSPYILKLALPPPQNQPRTLFDMNSLSPQASSEKHFYQKAILRKHDFVLDLEAASSFPPNVDVAYSFGKLDYKFTQYVHRSGVGLAQITDEGDILLLSNKLYNNRAIAFRDAERFVRNVHLDVGGGGSRMASATNYAPQLNSPASSPMLRATQLGQTAASPLTRPLQLQTQSPAMRAVADVVVPGVKLSAIVTPDSILHDIRTFCSDAAKLEAFYRDTWERASRPPTPQTHKTSVSSIGTLDSNIPHLGLGPSLLASREASPSPMRLIGGLPLPLPQRRQSQHPSDNGSASITDSPRTFSMPENRI